MRGAMRMGGNGSSRSLASQSASAKRANLLAKLAEAEVHPSEVAQLVMHFLVTEGFVDAAKALASETSAERTLCLLCVLFIPSASVPMFSWLVCNAAGVDLATVSDRMSIRRNVHAGNIAEAMEQTDTLHPELLCNNHELAFKLHKQRLLELVREGDVVAALEYSQERLAPLAEGKPELMKELESAVTLLAFEDPFNSPLSDLLDKSQRQRVAAELNAAILSSQDQEPESRLPLLLRKLLWTQDRLNEKAGGPQFDLNAIGLPDADSLLQSSTSQQQQQQQQQPHSSQQQPARRRRPL